MEMRAYLEGILRKIWLLAIIVVISFFIGRNIGNNQPIQFTASTTIILNGHLLASSAIPSDVVQIATPQSYAAQVVTPAQLTIISKHYPRLSRLELAKNILVSADKTEQLLLISVTDSHPQSAADIANYLAQQFITTQIANLMRQIDFYQNWQQRSMASLNTDINKLSLELQQLTSQPTITPTTQSTIQMDQNQLGFDEQSLFSSEEALKDLKNTRPLFAKAYVILQPATVSNETTVVPLRTLLYELIAMVIGLLAAIMLIIAMDFLTPVVRHKGEMQRIVGFSVLAELPVLFGFEQKRVLQWQRLFFSWRMTPLRLVCASIGASVSRGKAHTVLLTSPRRKRRLAALMAALLANSGHRTLLIDADWENSRLDEQLKQLGPCDMITGQGEHLSFVKKTTHSHLFVLSTRAMLAQNKLLTMNGLIERLPELGQMFGIIIIDAPPLTRSEAHLLATQASQTVLLVKKRRDSLHALKLAYTLCQELRLNVTSLLMT
jgi:capsular polysaccharide biosynthesis protein